MDDPKNNGQVQTEDELTSDYANNTFIQSTVWDVKLLFGELSARGTQQVDWHTAITLPWAQAKLFSYFLQLHVAGYELEYGKIKIPDAVMPVAPDTIVGNLGNDPKARALFELVSEAHKNFVASLK